MQSAFYERGNNSSFTERTIYIVRTRRISRITATEVDSMGRQVKELSSVPEHEGGLRNPTPVELAHYSSVGRPSSAFSSKAL